MLRIGDFLNFPTIYEYLSWVMVVSALDDVELFVLMQIGAQEVTNIRAYVHGQQDALSSC